MAIGLDPLEHAFAQLETSPLPALKALKGCLVGNAKRKLAVVGNRPCLVRLLDILLHPHDVALCRETLTIFAILAQRGLFPDRPGACCDGRTANSQAIEALHSIELHVALWALLRDGLAAKGALVLDALKALRVLHASVRQYLFPFITENIGLKEAVVEESRLPCLDIMRYAFESDNLPYLTRFLLGATLSSLSSPTAKPTELDAQIEPCITLCHMLAETIFTDAQQDKILFLLGQNDYLVFESLVALLELKRPQLAHAVINAMSMLVRFNGQAASRLQLTLSPKHHLAVDMILDHTKDASDEMRLSAAVCATSLFKAIDREREPLLHMMPQDNVRTILVVLLRLLKSNRRICTVAAFTLAYLVQNDTDLGSRACSLNVMQVLERLLTDASKQTYEPYMSQAQAVEVPRLRHAIMQLIASLSLESETARELVVKANLLHHIVAGLSDEDVDVRASACTCARALSRSITILRTHLVDAGAAKPLFALLSDTQPDHVKSTAIATCSNLLIEFSPMKEFLLECAVLPRLTELSHSPNSELRMNALVAIKNVAYWGDTKLKRLLMDHITWAYLLQLINDPETDIQAQALGIFRNAAAIKVVDIEWGINGVGAAQLLEVLQEKLSSPSDEVVVETLNIVVNIGSAHKGRELIYSRLALVKLLLGHLSHYSKEIRSIAVWATRVLASREPAHRRANENALRLRALGFETRLREMRDDAAPDVRDKVRDTLEMLDSASFRIE